MGIRTTVVLALGILVALGVQSASAHKKVHHSQVTIDFRSATSVWYGTVDSTRARCTRNRRAEVYRRLDGPDHLIGKDVTGTYPSAPENAYVIDHDGAPLSGEYVAIAKRKVLRRTSRHRHICARATSPTLAVVCRGACRSAQSPARLDGLNSTKYR